MEDSIKQIQKLIFEIKELRESFYEMNQLKDKLKKLKSDLIMLSYEASFFSQSNRDMKEELEFYKTRYTDLKKDLSDFARSI